jgi:uncharacterized membrane protein YphA (DoxX/SURF4 family)
VRSQFFRINEAKQKNKTRIALFICFTTGIILIFAGVGKMYDPYTGRSAILAVSGELFPSAGVGVGQSSALIATVTFLELALGLVLLLGTLRRHAAIAAILLLIIFSVYLSALLVIPDAPSCGCATMWGSSILDTRSQAVFGIVRNISFVFLLVWSVRRL